MLVTRAQDQSDAFASALEAAGALPIAVPLIGFEPPDDRAAAERAVHDAHTYAWVVFTSANGARAFFEIMDARREDARLFGSAKIAAIGTATAAALRERGVYPDLTPARFVAEDFAEVLLTATVPGDRILIYRAQEARDVLPTALRESGRHVDTVAAYKTVILRNPSFAEKLAQCDIVTLTSASTVRGFLENAGDVRAADAKIVACIGPVTAQAARDAGMRVDVVAQQSTAQGLIAALTLNS